MASSPDTADAGGNGAEFLARLRARDASAFMRLIVDYGPRMRAVIRRYLRDDADADDALQDAFISVSRAIDQFHEQSALSTWLHTIAARSALMKLRSKRRRLEETGIDDLVPHYDWIGHRVMPNAAEMGALARLEGREAQELVRNQIDKLPEMYRVVLMARDLEELSTQEAAESLGMTEAAIKTRLHRARAALRTLLEPYVLRGAI